MSESSAVPGFSPTRALRSLGIFGGVGLALSALGATTGLGVPCPWRALTGSLCPLCGGTHLGMALLRGDWGGAWAANPFVFVGLGVLAVLGAAWSVEALGGPAIRPPRALRWGQGVWWAIIGVVAVAFAVWRNVA